MLHHLQQFEPAERKMPKLVYVMQQFEHARRRAIRCVQGDGISWVLVYVVQQFEQV